MDVPIKCLVIDDDKVQRELLGAYIQEIEGVSLQAEAGTAMDGLRALKKNEIDLIFLDIEMPLMSGIEFLRTIQKEVSVIIISSEEKYALESYEYDVLDYLKKPFSLSRVIKSIERYKGKQGTQMPKSNEDDKYIYVKNKSQLERVELDLIYCIKGADDYVEIFCKDKKILVSSTLYHLAEKLPEKQFIRVHRSVILNINHVKKMDGNIVLVGTELITVSRTYRNQLLERLNTI